MSDFGDFDSGVKPAKGPAVAPAPAGGLDFDSFTSTKPAAPTPPLERPAVTATVGSFLKATGMEAASVGDLVLSIPAQLIGVGAGMAMRGRSLGKGESRAAQAESHADASEAMVEIFGNPIHKLMALGGLGGPEENMTTIDSAMTRAAQLLAKGGEWVEKNTGGVLTKGDVESITNTAMASAGGRGLEHGLRRIVSGPAAMEGVKLSPYAIERMRQENLREMTADRMQKDVEARAAEAAAVAQEATVKVTDRRGAEGAKIPKEAPPTVLNPVKGTFEPAIPEMGAELPKLTSRESAIEKVAGGRSFDLTAEERIAYKTFKEEPVATPLVDESGAPLKVPKSQRGAIDFSFGTRLEEKQLKDEIQQSKDMLRMAGDREQHGAWDYLANDAGKFFNENKYLLQKVEALKEVEPFIKDQQLAHDSSLSLARLQDTFKRFQEALDDPTKAPVAAQNIRYLLGEMDHKEILGRYLEAVQETRAGLSLRSPYQRAMAKEIDAALNNVRTIKGPSNQRGGVDPKLLARMSALGLGAWAGQHFGSDHDLMDAVLGAGAAALATKVSPRAAVERLKSLSKPDSRLKINELADYHEKVTTLAAIDVWGLQKQVEDLVPKTERRAAITHAMEKGDLSKLSPEEVKAAGIVRDYYDQKLWEGINEDILKSAKKDYVTHLWDWSKNDKGLIASWLDRSEGGGGMSSNSRFAKERTVPTIEAGKAQGLTPITEDISTIMGIYGNSMSRSIANSQFMKALKSETTPNASAAGPVQPTSLVLAADKAPHSYVSINHPQFAGLRVHPDIAPSVKMLFDTSSPGTAMKIAQGLSDTVKRVAVSFSLFHAKALTDAMIGGSKNPFTAVGKIPGFIAGTDAYLKELRQGSASPLVQRAVDGGLKFSLEKAGAGVEDAGAGFYSSMTALENLADKTIPGAGSAVRGITAVNHKVDTFMWARLHAGMKLNMFAEKYQELIDNSAKAQAEGRGNALTPEQASRIASSYTNDLFGGINWRRVAEDSKTRWGRELGQATLNPGARRVLQLAMFAPDWTISTTRAALQAFGEGTGARGLISPTTLADLHRQYVVRAGLYYVTVGDAINYAYSGHHIWQNKDPTVLDMNPEGTKHMQWSKHTMEPAHWLTKPGQQAINKLGFIPKELAAQALGVEYLSASGRMPPMENRTKHLARNFMPIVGQQATSGTVGEAAAGFAGFPIYGKTKEERDAARAEKKRKKDEALLEAGRGSP